MKRIFLTTALLAFFTFSYGQGFEITPFGGLLATGRVKMFGVPGNYPEQYAKVDDLGNYGFRLGVILNTDFLNSIDFEWNHTDSNFKYLDQNDQQVTVPFSSNYFMVGALRELSLNSFRPYAIINMGIVHFRNTDSTEFNFNRFAAGAGIGTKILLSDNFGLRIQGRLMAPFRFDGLTFGCGFGISGSGCGTALTTSSATIQADITGGVILILDNP